MMKDFLESSMVPDITHFSCCYPKMLLSQDHIDCTSHHQQESEVVALINENLYLPDKSSPDYAND
jgi:hypothetical protein